MGERVQRFGRNTGGRDFVVSDIHGCYDQLRQALDDVDFDLETDRLFSVGDLIDRGPQSADALEWLAQPWFHACMGNHEEMSLTSLVDQSIFLSWVIFNGGSWWLTQDADTRVEFLTAFQKLPLAMEVATAQGRVGIVHADIPEKLTWQAFLDALESADDATCETALWGRQRAAGLVETPVQGVDQVVCGHTITPDFRIHRYANVWCIDTGAFLSGEGGRLTLLTLDSLFQGSDTTVDCPCAPS